MFAGDYQEQNSRCRSPSMKDPSSRQRHSDGHGGVMEVRGHGGQQQQCSYDTSAAGDGRQKRVGETWGGGGEMHTSTPAASVGMSAHQRGISDERAHLRGRRQCVRACFLRLLDRQRLRHRAGSASDTGPAAPPTPGPAGEMDGQSDTPAGGVRYPSRGNVH